MRCCCLTTIRAFTRKANELDQQKLPTQSYEHARYETRRRFLRFLMRTIGFSLLARVDKVEGVDHVPARGPVILMINHIALIDPLLVMHVLPRNIVPMAKIEVYSYPVIGILPKIWGVIPVRREEFDRQAIQQVFEVLKAGEIVLVAPEGTRSPQLQTARVGVAYLASRSQVPVVPVAISGTIGFPTLPLTKRWAGPKAQVRFGKPFCFRPELQRANREELRKMADEAMYILAGELPTEQRGVYADMSQATQDTIRWL